MNKILPLIQILRGCCLQEISQDVRSKLLPETPAPDPFFSDSNMKALDESEEQYKAGKTVVKTMEELEALADA